MAENTDKTINKLKELKNAYKEALSEAAGGSEAAAIKAGQFKDQINDLNESVKNFAAGSKFEQLGNVFGTLGGKLSNLDFGGAAEDAARFAAISKTLTFKEATAGLGQLTSSLGTLGKAILTNPLFLIVGVLVAVGVAVVKLKDSIGPLKAIFDALGDAVDWVVQKFKDFSDSIGLSNFALEENSKKLQEWSQNAVKEIDKRFGREIELASAAGKKTEEIQILKEKFLLRALDVELKAIEKVAAARGEATDEEKKRIEELNKAIFDANTSILVNEAKINKNKADENKKASEDRIKAEQDLIKKIQDLQVANIQDAQTKELDSLRLKDDRERESIEKSKASQAQKNQALLLLDTQYQQSVDAINEKYRAERQKAEEDDLKRKEEILAKEKALEEKRIADIQANNQRVNDKANADLLAGLELRALQNLNDLESLRAFNDAKMQIELENTELTENEKLLIKEQYVELDRQLQLKSVSNFLEVAEKSIEAAQGLSDTIFAIKNANLEKGSAEELAAAKKQFKINKALQIGSAIINGAQAATRSLAAAPLAIGVAPNPVGIASLVAVIATTAASVAKIAATQFEAPSAGGGITAPRINGPSASATGVSGAAAAAPRTPSIRAIGGNNRTSNGEGGAEGGRQPVKVYVVSQEVEAARDKDKVISRRASF